MGFFSYTCAKTGLPILADGPWRDVGASEVVALYPNGDRIRGSYDGYGRVGGREILDDMDRPGGAKLVLAEFFANEKYDSLGTSNHEPGQGYFHDEAFINAMFTAARAGSIETRQYEKRLREYEEMASSPLQIIARHVSSDPQAFAENAGGLRFRRWMAGQEADDEEKGYAKRFAKLRETLPDKWKTLSPKKLGAEIWRLERIVMMQAARIVIDAWKKNVPAATEDLSRYLPAASEVSTRKRSEVRP